MADGARISAVASRLFVQAYGPTHPEPELSRYLGRSFGVGWASRELAKATTAILAVEDCAGTLCGYAHVQLTTTRPPAGVVGERPAEIVRFYLDTALHGRGVAQALMEACNDETLRWGSDVMWLAVWKRASRPFAFYSKCGFRVVGETIFRFGERIDHDYVMARPVKPKRIDI